MYFGLYLLPFDGIVWKGTFILRSTFQLSHAHLTSLRRTTIILRIHTFPFADFKTSIANYYHRQLVQIYWNPCWSTAQASTLTS